MATVRTVFSPRCCATSSTRVLPWFCPWSALRIEGSSPSNFTSTTAPMTWAMVPMVFLAMVRWSSLERLGARDDLDELFGNGRLTRAVVGDGEAVDPIAGIGGCAVHRGHPLALPARAVLEERRRGLHRQVSPAVQGP